MKKEPEFISAKKPADLPSTMQAAWLAPLMVALITLVIYLPTLLNDFVNLDDDKTLLVNPNYRGLGWERLRWMFTTFDMGHYMPLSWLTWGLDYVLWGMNAAGYHLTNALLHAANAPVLLSGHGYVQPYLQTWGGHRG